MCYLSAATAGTVTGTPPVVAGNVQLTVGRMLNATNLAVDIGEPVVV